MLFCLASIFTIIACQKNNHTADLEQQIKQMKEKIVSHANKKPILTESFVTPSATYQAEKLRDPFEEPPLVSKRISTQTGPLHAFSLSEIRFIGVISEAQQTFAIIMTPDDHAYQVKLGDQIGNQYGKIININQNQIEIVETVTDEKNRPIQHTVVIRFKG